MKCGPNVCATVVQLYRIVYSVGFITLGLMPFEASRAEWRVEVSFQDKNVVYRGYPPFLKGRTEYRRRRQQIPLPDSVRLGCPRLPPPTFNPVSEFPYVGCLGIPCRHVL